MNEVVKKLAYKKDTPTKVYTDGRRMLFTDEAVVGLYITKKGSSVEKQEAENLTLL